MGFIARLTDIVEDVGLEPVPGTPVCLPRSALGDTVDHVAPRLRTAATRTYFALLRPYLAEADRSADAGSGPHGRQHRIGDGDVGDVAMRADESVRQ